MSAGDGGRIRVRDVRVLSDDWYVLRRTTCDYRRRAGTWRTLSRETYDRGDGGVEAEDIELLELTLGKALAMVGDGRIMDAKTVLLLQYAKMQGLLA